MDVEVDYNPSPQQSYFLSVKLNETDWLSFDCTTKGHRVIKQVLRLQETPETAVEKYGALDGEWEVLSLRDGKFIRRYHAQWIDRDRLDTVNGETWETVWECPVPAGVDERLRAYSQLISDHYENLTPSTAEVADHETWLAGLVQGYAAQAATTL